MRINPSQINRGRVLPLIIDSPATLRAMWMPFILSGAVFVPGVEDAGLGEPIFLLLLLPGANEPIAAGGRVVWISPAAARRGIGVRLRDADDAAKSAIEKCLATPPITEGGELYT